MNTTIKLAFRNLFRNKRRTLIIISSVFFSAFLCIVMISMTNGSCDYIVDAVVERQTGAFQVMSPQYWEDKTLDNFIEVDEQTLLKWKQTKNVKRITPRIETYTMAWNGTRTKGLSLTGIDPSREAQFSGINKRIIEGNYLTQNDKGVIVGSKCAETLELTIGDTLTLIGQGFQGESANGLFVVKGILKDFDPNLDAVSVYMSLEAAREFISMPNGVSTVSIALNKKEKAEETIAIFKTETQEGYAYNTWQDLIKGTMAGASENKKSMLTYIYFLYVIVGFGLLSMAIMLTNERMKEFGIMTAIGTSKKMIIGSLFLELVFVGLLGVLAGTLFSVPIVAYYHYFPIALTGELEKALLDFGLDPVMPFEFKAELFINQALIVFFMAMAVCIYPLYAILKLKTIEAIRG